MIEKTNLSRNETPPLQTQKSPPMRVGSHLSARHPRKTCYAVKLSKSRQTKAPIMLSGREETRALAWHISGAKPSGQRSHCPIVPPSTGREHTDGGWGGEDRGCYRAKGGDFAAARREQITHSTISTIVTLKTHTCLGKKWHPLMLCAIPWNTKNSTPPTSIRIIQLFTSNTKKYSPAF